MVTLLLVRDPPAAALCKLTVACVPPEPVTSEHAANGIEAITGTIKTNRRKVWLGIDFWVFILVSLNETTYC